MEEDATQPRWLSPAERQTWMELVELMVRLPAALDSHLQHDAGLSHFEYQVLACLSDAPERTMRMSVLAQLANGSLSRLSHVISRLEKRGWVHRSPDPSDGRSTRATLTDEGWEKVVATAPSHVENVRALVFDPLTQAQQRQLAEIGRRLNRVLAPEGPHHSDDCPG